MTELTTTTNTQLDGIYNLDVAAKTFSAVLSVARVIVEDQDLINRWENSKNQKGTQSPNYP